MSNEAHRNMGHSPGFAFIADGKGLRLFQGGAEVCRGQQQACKGDEVYRGSKAPTVSQQINQKDGGRRQGPGRGRRGGRTSCGKPQVPGVSQ
jgi:hypothetical protein